MVVLELAPTDRMEVRIAAVTVAVLSLFMVVVAVVVGIMAAVEVPSGFLWPA
jgi:hypothetical protein